MTPILDWSVFLRAAFITVKCGFDMMVPVECTKRMTSTWDHTRLYPMCLMANYGLLWWLCLCCGVRYSRHFSQAFATSHPTPVPSASCPPTPLATLAQNWCAPSKNGLKWPEIKQVTNIKLHYNKVNKLMNPVLQKIVSPTRAKASSTN